MNGTGNDSNIRVFDHWWRLPSKVWHSIVPPITVSKRIAGVKTYLCLRDNVNYLVSTRGIELEVKKTLAEPCKSFWDVGSNVGIFSLIAADQGKDVIAFDISEKAIKYVRRSAAANNFNIRTRQSAFTVKKVLYQKVSSSHTENRVVEGGQESATEESTTYLDAAKKYGIPDMIKMDIEGGELDFFQSSEFKEWIIDNDITFAVEIHSDEIRQHIWQDVPHRSLNPSHIVYNPKAG